MIVWEKGALGKTQSQECGLLVIVQDEGRDMPGTTQDEEHDSPGTTQDKEHDSSEITQDEERDSPGTTQGEERYSCNTMQDDECSSRAANQDREQTSFVTMGESHWATNIAGRLSGLLGGRHDDATLVLAPCNDVHTFGMNRCIDIAFVGPNGQVMESQRNVGASERMRVGKAAFVIERAYNPCAPWPAEGDTIELGFRRESA